VLRQSTGLIALIIVLTNTAKVSRWRSQRIPSMDRSAWMSARLEIVVENTVEDYAKSCLTSRTHGGGRENQSNMPPASLKPLGQRSCMHPWQMPPKAAPFRKPLQTLLAKKINAAPNKAPSSFLTLSVPGRSGLTNLRDRRGMSHELVSRLKDAFRRNHRPPEAR
jgi:hypothetical protein